MGSTTSKPGEAPRVRRLRMPALSQFGLGFWQAWWTLAFCSDTILDTRADEVLGFAPGTLLLGSTTLGFLATILIAMFMRKAGSSFSGHPGLYAKSAAACALGSLAMALASHGSLGTGPAVPFIFAAAALVFSVGNALLITMWGELWSTLATGKVGRCLYTSYIIAIVLYLLMIGLPVYVRVGLLMLLPAVSCLILHHAQSEPKRDQGTVPTPPPGSMAPWLVRALVATFALNFVWGVALPLLGTSAYTPDALELATSPTPAAQKALRDAVGLPGALSTHAGFLVTLGCLVVLYLYMVTAKPEVEAFTLYPPVGCALAGGLALALVLPEELSFIAYGLAFLGGACLDMLIMLVATDMAYRMQRPVAITLGVTLLIGRLGSFVGRLALDLLATNQTASHGVILPACLLVIIVCGFAVFSSYHLGILYRIRPKLPEPASIEQRCEALSRAHGLTTRESEILALLARGRSAPFIADELTLALGTVKNHISNIYRKVDVADRQGLLNAIERTDCAAPAESEAAPTLDT